MDLWWIGSLIHLHREVRSLCRRLGPLWVVSVRLPMHTSLLSSSASAPVQSLDALNPMKTALRNLASGLRSKGNHRETQNAWLQGGLPIARR